MRSARCQYQQRAVLILAAGADDLGRLNTSGREVAVKPNQSDKLVEQGGNRSPPIKGRGRGGVCILLSKSWLQTPPRPSGTPPLDGRGAAARPCDGISDCYLNPSAKVSKNHDNAKRNDGFLLVLCALIRTSGLRPKVLALDKSQKKSELSFGFVLAYSYLCNLNY